MRSGDLTDAEIKRINRTGRCPDCRQGELMEGPWGGCTVNARCKECGQEFFLGIFVDCGGRCKRVVMGGRLDRDMPDLYNKNGSLLDIRPAPSLVNKIVGLLSGEDR